jgi:putative Mn2+ efflux pump MntP
MLWDVFWGVVLIVVGGVIMYLVLFRKGIKEGLRKLKEKEQEQQEAGLSGYKSWLPFTFVVSLMLILVGVVLVGRGISC